MSDRLTLNPFVLLVALLGAYVVLSLLSITSARAQTTTTGGGTVIICEATGNPNAPYVEVDVAQADLGNYGAAEGDIIPAPPGGCPSRAAGAGPTKRPHRRKHPATHPSPSHTAPAPRLTPAPPPVTSSQPAAAPEPTSPASTPTESATAPSSAHSLPKTGGHTPITIVLGLLLLYCGGVIRWAGATPEPGRFSAPRH